MELDLDFHVQQQQQAGHKVPGSISDPSDYNVWRNMVVGKNASGPLKPQPGGGAHAESISDSLNDPGYMCFYKASAIYTEVVKTKPGNFMETLVDPTVYFMWRWMELSNVFPGPIDRVTSNMFKGFGLWHDTFHDAETDVNSDAGVDVSTSPEKDIETFESAMARECGPQLDTESSKRRRTI